MPSFRAALLIAPLILAAGCGGGGAGGNSSAPADQAKAVAPPAGQQWVDVVSKTPEGGYRMGNPDAPVKLIEFGSRSCHVCAAFDAEGVEPLKANYVASGRVSYEYRDFIRSPVDIAATMIGECNGVEPFFPLLHQTMATQEATLNGLQAQGPALERIGALPPAQQIPAFAEVAGYIDFAKQRGIPEAKARQCLADGARAEALASATQKASEQYGITGTPTFIVNGEKADAVSWQQLEPLLKAAGG